MKFKDIKNYKDLHKYYLGLGGPNDPANIVNQLLHLERRYQTVQDTNGKIYGAALEFGRGMYTCEVYGLVKPGDIEPGPEYIHDSFLAIVKYNYPRLMEAEKKYLDRKQVK